MSRASRILNEAQPRSTRGILASDLPDHVKARSLDTLALRLPGNSGQQRDAVAASNEIKKRLGNGDVRAGHKIVYDQFFSQLDAAKVARRRK